MTFSRSWVQRWRLQTTFPTNALLRWRRTDSTVCRRRVVVTINVSKQWLLARWQDFSPLQLTSAAAHFLSQECTRMQYISLQIKKFRRSRPLDRLDFRAGGKILPHLYPCALCPVPCAQSWCSSASFTALCVWCNILFWQWQWNSATVGKIAVGNNVLSQYVIVLYLYVSVYT